MAILVAYEFDLSPEISTDGRFDPWLAGNSVAFRRIDGIHASWSRAPAEPTLDVHRWKI